MNVSSPLLSPVDALLKAHVLIIDDDHRNYEVLDALLKKAHITNTSYAGNIDAAFKILAQNPPQIILLDIMMPDISGFDFCEKLKQTPEYTQTPVIFISALRGADIRAKAFNLGGVDYLQKPYDRNETIARIRVHLENGLMMDALRQQADMMHEELRLGAQVQQSLLPSRELMDDLSRKFNCQLASAFAPCGALAGDFWQLLPIDDSHFAIAVCDYSGHGVASALETVRFHSLLYELRPLWSEPNTLFAEMNKRLFRILPPETFATFNYALINSRNKTAQILSAGGPSVAHLKPGGYFSQHHTPAMPLGAAPNGMKPHPHKLSLRPGTDLCSTVTP